MGLLLFLLLVLGLLLLLLLLLLLFVLYFAAMVSIGTGHMLNGLVVVETCTRQESPPWTQTNPMTSLKKTFKLTVLRAERPSLDSRRVKPGGHVRQNQLKPRVHTIFRRHYQNRRHPQPRRDAKTRNHQHQTSNARHRLPNPRHTESGRRFRCKRCRLPRPAK